MVGIASRIQASRMLGPIAAATFAFALAPKPPPGAFELEPMGPRPVVVVPMASDPCTPTKVAKLPFGIPMPAPNTLSNVDAIPDGTVLPDPARLPVSPGTPTARLPATPGSPRTADMPRPGAPFTPFADARPYPRGMVIGVTPCFADRGMVQTPPDTKDPINAILWWMASAFGLAA